MVHSWFITEAEGRKDVGDRMGEMECGEEEEWKKIVSSANKQGK